MGNKVNASYDADNHLMSLTRNGEMLAKLAWDRQGHLTRAEDEQRKPYGIPLWGRDKTPTARAGASCRRGKDPSNL